MNKNTLSFRVSLFSAIIIFLLLNILHYINTIEDAILSIIITFIFIYGLNFIGFWGYIATKIIVIKNIINEKTKKVANKFYKNKKNNIEKKEELNTKKIKNDDIGDFEFEFEEPTEETKIENKNKKKLRIPMKKIIKKDFNKTKKIISAKKK
jgi:hypothetical protein